MYERNENIEYTISGRELNEFISNIEAFQDMFLTSIKSAEVKYFELLEENSILPRMINEYKTLIQQFEGESKILPYLQECYQNTIEALDYRICCSKILEQYMKNSDDFLILAKKQKESLEKFRPMGGCSAEDYELIYKTSKEMFQKIQNLYTLQLQILKIEEMIEDNNKKV